MATSKAQRIGIWVIAGALIAGTTFGFLAMILSSKNNEKSQQSLAAYQAEYTAFQAKIKKQEDAVTARTTELSSKYFAAINAQKSRVAPFDAASIKAVTVDEIAAGSGAVIGEDSTYLAYYIGFTPDGKIFDSSFSDDKTTLKAPFIARPNGTIQGWKEGMKGKKIGGTYLLKITSDKAYGADGSGELIKPNTPLTFVILPIESLETLSEPQITQEVINAYSSQQQ